MARGGAREPGVDEHGAQSSLPGMTVTGRRPASTRTSGTSSTSGPTAGGHREDHHRPPGGPQRLPAADPVRAARGVHARPGRPRGRRDHPHRRGPGRVLLGRRPAHPRRRRLHRRRQRRAQGHRAPERARPADPDAPLPEAGRGDDRGLRDRRRPRPARLLRPLDRRRQRALRPDRPARRAPSTAASARACSPARSARSAPRRSGSCAGSTTPRPALDWGLVNAVVPLERLEEETVAWCREMLALSPLALRMLKASFNAAEDGLAGVQQLAGDATLLFYMSEEAQEGRDAYVEKRRPDFSQVPAPALATSRACGSGSWPRGRGRCPRRSRPCSSARRWP